MIPTDSHKAPFSFNDPQWTSVTRTEPHFLPLSRIDHPTELQRLQIYPADLQWESLFTTESSPTEPPLSPTAFPLSHNNLSLTHKSA